MTTISVMVGVDTPAGHEQIAPHLTATPTKTRWWQGAVILPQGFTLTLGENQTINLDPTDNTWCWKITLTHHHKGVKYEQTRHVVVPDVEETLNYQDLTDVDPGATGATGPKGDQGDPGPVYVPPVKSHRHMKLSAAKAIATGVYTTLNTLASGAGDQPTSGITVSDGVFTVPETGVYLIEGNIGYPTTTDNQRYARILIDGTNGYRRITAPPSTGTATASITLAHHLTAGDTIELQAYQNTGANVTLPVDADLTRISITQL